MTGLPETSDKPLPGDELERRLSLLRVAKDVFLSDWYLRASDALVSAEGRAVLRQVSAESGKERDAALALVKEWGEQDERRPDEAHGVRALQATMARDFLDALIEMKQASADMFQKAAAIAPPGLRARFYELANVDLVHAMALRQLILAEFPSPSEMFLGSASQYPEPSSVGPEAPATR